MPNKLPVCKKVRREHRLGQIRSAQDGFALLHSIAHSIVRDHRARMVVYVRLTAIIGALLLLVLARGAMYQERYLAGSGRPIDSYPQFSLDGVSRLLVIAPHCDDEVLAAAGLIQAALHRGLHVHVVIVTNGDGYLVAAMEQARSGIPRAQDYVALGEHRQLESMQALARLGVPADEITFLGYPDRGLAVLWWEHWKDDSPYRSPQSRRAQSPYARTYRADAPYSGVSLLQDLREVLVAEHPDLVLSPHPNDEHTDHRALHAFVSLAMEMEQRQRPEFSPQRLTYLIHYGLFPQPRGLKPGESLCPPRQLDTLGDWPRWPLSAEEVKVKRQAISAYRSQVRLQPQYLYSFARQNELFMAVQSVIPLDPIEAEHLVDTDSVPTISHKPDLAADNDPTRDSVLREVWRGADIAGLHVYRLGDNLWVALDLYGRASRNYDYELRMRTFGLEDTTTWETRYGSAVSDDVLTSGRRIWYRLDGDALGEADWLALAAETRQGVVIDRTAWYLFALKEWPWHELEQTDDQVR